MRACYYCYGCYRDDRTLLLSAPTPAFRIGEQKPQAASLPTSLVELSVCVHVLLSALRNVLLRGDFIAVWAS